MQATVRTLRHADYGVEDSAFVVLDYGDRLAEVRLTWAARRRRSASTSWASAASSWATTSASSSAPAPTEEVAFDDGHEPQLLPLGVVRAR